MTEIVVQTTHTDWPNQNRNYQMNEICINKIERITYIHGNFQ